MHQQIDHAVKAQLHKEASDRGVVQEINIHDTLNEDDGMDLDDGGFTVFENHTETASRGTFGLSAQSHGTNFIVIFNLPTASASTPSMIAPTAEPDASPEANGSGSQGVETAAGLLSIICPSAW